MTPPKSKSVPNIDQGRIAIFCRDESSLNVLRSQFTDFWAIPYEINPASQADFLANLVYDLMPSEKIVKNCPTLVLPTVGETFDNWLRHREAQATVERNIEVRLLIDEKTEITVRPQRFYRYHGDRVFPIPDLGPTTLLMQLGGSTIFLLSIDAIGEIEEILKDGLHPHLSGLLRIYARTALSYSLIPAKLRDSFLRATGKIHEKTIDYRSNCSLDAFRFLLLMCLKVISRDPIPTKPFWKDGKRYACCVTHDIETLEGLRRAKRMQEAEKRYGVRSAWNIPSDRFELCERTIRELAQWGEIGAHGTVHDGKLAALEEDKMLERMRRCKAKLERIADTQVLGFRAPLLQGDERIVRTARKAGFRYDSSCPTWEPASTTSAGAHGVRTIFPIILNGIVEIPVTLPQDHQMIRVLDRTPEQCVGIWIEIKNLIRALGGLCTILTHPDYDFGQPTGISLYEQLLKELANDSECWVALPHEIAEWWVNRHERCSPKTTAENARRSRSHVQGSSKGSVQDSEKHLRND